MSDAIDHCLSAPPAAPLCETLEHWWPGFRRLAADWRRPFDLAVVAGFSADRAGWAFAGAYQACLYTLVENFPVDRLGAFCVTEDNGNRPKDILTRITPSPGGGWTLNGTKRWAIAGTGDGRFLVAGNLAEGGRPEIRIVAVDQGTPGLKIEAMPPTRFVPEVTHARLVLEGVQVPDGAMLPEDGHDRYVKPMRTLEDTLVTAALLALLVREGRARRWPRDWIVEAFGALASLSTVADRDPSAATTHVLLAGALAAARRAFDAADGLWSTTPDPAAERWRRDALLTGMAGPVRQLRLDRAWQRLEAAQRAA